jgi:uncharacterized protein
VPDSMDAGAIRRWCAGGLDALRRHQSEIDDLNVFPVPDADTGTNLLLTMEAAAAAMDATLPRATRAIDYAPAARVGAVLGPLARGAMLGARGNSGIILAQYLRGLADALADVDRADGRTLASALELAGQAAYRAVATPVEGTVLTGASAAAGAAVAANSPSAVETVASAARAAWSALAHTPEQLGELARAGVLDAGGFGLAVLFDALLEALGGRADPQTTVGHRAAVPGTVARESGSERYEYEVQYLLEAAPRDIERLRLTLRTFGDSLAVVGGSSANGRPQTWNVHVHVNDVGAAIEAGVIAGRPYRISVTRFADQATERGISASQGASAAPETPASPDSAPGLVVLCAGGGLRDLFTAEGAVVVPTDAGTPTGEAILDAILATGAGRVVVLPNASAVAGVATAVAIAVARARASGVHATVVPTSSPVQALAALAVRDPHRRFEDDVIAMAEAAGACRNGTVIRAEVRALTVVGPCVPGDVLALVDGEVNLIGQDVVEVGLRLLDRLLASGGELVTLILGKGEPEAIARTLSDHVREGRPFVEVQSYIGDQPDCPLLIGVE